MARHSPKDGTAVLILDMISEYRFPNGDRILRGARQASKAIARLKARARDAGVPVIYVNDTAGKWESDQQSFVQRCARPNARARDVVERLAPLPSDYFIFKPRHSAFFDTPLASLLDRLQVGTLVLTGVTSHQCVLFTGMDAHVRGLKLIVAKDCIGAAAPADTQHALYIFQRALDARIASSRALRL